MSSGFASGLQVIFGLAFSIIPLIVLVWVLQQLRAVAVDLNILRRQMQEIAAHMGAPIATERGVRRPLPKEPAS